MSLAIIIRNMIVFTYFLKIIHYPHFKINNKKIQSIRRLIEHKSDTKLYY